MVEKLLVTVAPCIPPYAAKGIRGLDLSVDGIGAEVVRAYNAGANVVHLHVWDESGHPTTDLEPFERTIRLVRERCDIVIEGSTGGVNELTAAERSVALQADVEMASLNPAQSTMTRGSTSTRPVTSPTGPRRCSAAASSRTWPSLRLG